MTKNKPKNKRIQQKEKRVSALQASDVSSEQQPPLFSLRYLDNNYSLSNCTKDEKAAFADTLHRLSQVTWNQINSLPRHGLGYERISRSSITAAIPSHVKEDVNLIAFRFCGKAPMVGYRDRAVFYIIWLDLDFTLYPHT